MARIFSKKSFRFNHPSDSTVVSVTVPALEFSDVPDWVTESEMWKLAASEDSVEVIKNRADEAKAEKKASSKAGE